MRQIMVMMAALSVAGLVGACSQATAPAASGLSSSAPEASGVAAKGDTGDNKGTQGGTNSGAVK